MDECEQHKDKVYNNEEYNGNFGCRVRVRYTKLNCQRHTDQRKSTSNINDKRQYLIKSQKGNNDEEKEEEDTEDDGGLTNVDKEPYLLNDSFFSHRLNVAYHPSTHI